MCLLYLGLSNEENVRGYLHKKLAFTPLQASCLIKLVHLEFIEPLHPFILAPMVRNEENSVLTESERLSVYKALNPRGVAASLFAQQHKTRGETNSSAAFDDWLLVALFDTFTQCIGAKQPSDSDSEMSKKREANLHIYQLLLTVRDEADRIQQRLLSGTGGAQQRMKLPRSDREVKMHRNIRSMLVYVVAQQLALGFLAHRKSAQDAIFSVGQCFKKIACA